MKIFREDWKRLRIPLVSALILASLGGAFVFLGESYLAECEICVGYFEAGDRRFNWQR